MTADERATLAKVAELLDESGPNGSIVPWAARREALRLVRGLLADPQVNPSEAKDMERERISYFMALERIRERCRQNQPENGAAAFAFNEARRVLEDGFQLRARQAGLLAEGEESREP